MIARLRLVIQTQVLFANILNDFAPAPRDVIVRVRPGSGISPPHRARTSEELAYGEQLFLADGAPAARGDVDEELCGNGFLHGLDVADQADGAAAFFQVVQCGHGGFEGVGIE